VAEIKTERALVETNRKLAEILGSEEEKGTGYF
jgi:hypothetical protein